MDPLLELSTLTASYLWALREVFAESEVAGTIPIDKLLMEVYRPLPTERDGHDTPKIFDFALCTRLRDIAERKDGEHWTPRPTAKFRERVREGIAGTDALETRFYQRKLKEATKAQGYFESVRTSWTHRLESRHYEELAKEQLQDITKHTTTRQSGGRCSPMRIIRRCSSPSATERPRAAFFARAARRARGN